MRFPREDAAATLRIVWYGAIAIGVAVLIAFIGWRLYPTQLAYVREAVQNSHQYVDAKKSMLLKLAEEYDAAEADIAKYRAADPVKFKDVIKGLEAQQEILSARIRSEAKMIALHEVPDSVRKHLR